jgi:hypothetical protein
VRTRGWTDCRPEAEAIRPVSINVADDPGIGKKEMTMADITTGAVENIAPEVFRQRLLVEGFFQEKLTEKSIAESLLQLAGALELRTYGDPVIFQPSSGMGKRENSGFDAFVPLIDSGISGYFWTEPGFFSMLIYTCKGFDNTIAISTIRSMYKVSGRIVAHAF